VSGFVAVEDSTLPSTFVEFLAKVRVNPSLNEGLNERLFRLAANAKEGGEFDNFCKPRVFLVWSSVFFALLLSALTLIDPLAEKNSLEQNISLAQARKDILVELQLDDVLYWSSEVSNICEAFSQPASLDGICSISDTQALVAPIVFGIGAADRFESYAYEKTAKNVIPQSHRVADFLAPMADPCTPLANIVTKQTNCEYGKPWFFRIDSEDQVFLPVC